MFHKMVVEQLTIMFQFVRAHVRPPWVGHSVGDAPGRFSEFSPGDDPVWHRKNSTLERFAVAGWAQAECPPRRPDRTRHPVGRGEPAPNC